MDKRGDYTTGLLKTGGPSTLEADARDPSITYLTLDIELYFPEQIAGALDFVQLQNLRLTPLQAGAVIHVSTVYPAPGSSSRIIRLSQTLLYSGTAVEVKGSILTLSFDANWMGAGAVCSSYSYRAADSIQIVIEDSLQCAVHSAVEAPTLLPGFVYEYILPMGLFALGPGISTTADSSVKILGGKVNLGAADGTLIFIPGEWGRSMIRGRVTVNPAPFISPGCFGGASTSHVVFTLHGSDDTGCDLVADICIPVQVSLPVLELPIISLNLEPLHFDESSATKFKHIDETSFFTFPSGATQYPISEINVIMLSIDRTLDTDALKEKLVATNPNPTLLTLSTYTQSTLLMGSIVLRANAGAHVSPAEVTSFLRGLQYHNDRTVVTSGTRRISITVFNSDYGSIVTATREVIVKSFNNPPVVSFASPSLDIAYVYPNDGARAILPTLTISDPDDASVVSAEVRLYTEPQQGVFGACDSKIEILKLSAVYTSDATAPLRGDWVPSICAMILRPATSIARTVTHDELATALQAIRYQMLQLPVVSDDPAVPPRGGWGWRRQFELTLYDAANDFAAGVMSARTNTIKWFLDFSAAVDIAPVIHFDKAYSRAEGIFSSNDPYANTKEIILAGQKYYQFKHPLIVPGNSAAPLVFKIPLPMLIRREKAGSFANGCITDIDTSGPPGLADIAVSCNGAACPGGITLLTVNPLPRDAATLATDGDAYVELSVDPSAAALGEVGIMLQYGTQVASTSVAALFVDIRRPACTTDALISPFVLYPDASLCVPQAPSFFVPGSSDSLLISPFGLESERASMETKAKQLTSVGYTREQVAAELVAERATNKGKFSLHVAAESISSLSPVPITVQSIGKDALPVNAAGLDLQNVQHELTFKMGPACTKFVEPAKFCLFVGNSQATWDLVISHQLDCYDPSKGYSQPEQLLNIQYDYMTGTVCGDVPHFSILFTRARQIVQGSTQEKDVRMGSGCPNNCMKQGFCRQPGTCICFQGFDGYDCSQRTCPWHSSWDSEDGLMHLPAECSGRGLCDRTLGTCKCFPGYEGHACQRMLCPNDCSRRGKCRLLSEMRVARTSTLYKSSWDDANSIVGCVCDGGYTGADCSLRTCPFGDDKQGSQVQRLTLDFHKLPVDVLSDGISSSLLDASQVNIGLRLQDGTRLPTRISSVLDVGGHGPENVQHALMSVPGAILGKVEVRGELSASQAAHSYLITFTESSARTGEEEDSIRVSASMPLLECLENMDGTLGCPSVGCSPRTTQLRILSVPPVSTGVEMVPDVLLIQPPPLSPADPANHAGYPVEVTISVKHTSNLPDAGQYYEATASIYGRASSESVPRTSMPPTGRFRKEIPILHGLFINFSDSVIVDGDYVFRWALPTCSVSLERGPQPQIGGRECSNHGICNHQDGTCRCVPGYVGHNCGQSVDDDGQATI
jgi:hypothetical protein